MKKATLMLVILLVVSILFTGCSLNSDKQGSDNPNAGSTNYMVATVDGTRYSFEFTKVRVWGNQIMLYCTAYNPRGESILSILVSLDTDIVPGRYTSKNSTAMIITSNLMQAHGGTENGFSKRLGSFDLNLTYRSADWRTYQGTFSAELVKEATMVSGRKTMNISDASFRFTLP